MATVGGGEIVCKFPLISGWDSLKRVTKREVVLRLACMVVCSLFNEIAFAAPLKSFSSAVREYQRPGTN